MKFKTIYTALLVLCVVFSSCLEDKRPTNPMQSNTSQIDTTSVKDSLSKDTIAQSKDSVAQAPVVYQAEIIKKEDDSPTFWELLSIGLGGLALVLGIVIWYLMAQMDRNVSHAIRELEQDMRLKISNANKIALDRCKNVEDKNLNLHTDVDRLSERVKRIENNYTQSTNYVVSDRNFEEYTEEAIQPKKRGYFGIVKRGTGIAMFNDILKSRNEGAYFEVDYLDDERCEFSPIDLDKIRSIDAVGEAIEYNGDMGYAKSMKTLSKGKAVLDKEHGFWRITDKAKIELKA
ncbi:MAG: hypothetical protein IJ841_09035 [Prevotella sp.]|nr:hypothetical protein [Prevotella sp.]